MDVNQQVLNRLNLLISRGWTRREIAELLGVITESVSNWCSGKPSRQPKTLLYALDHPAFRRVYAGKSRSTPADEGATAQELLRDLMDRGWTIKALADEMGVTWISAKRLIDEQTTGRNGKLLALALQHPNFQRRAAPKGRRYAELRAARIAKDRAYRNALRQAREDAGKAVSTNAQGSATRG